MKFFYSRILSVALFFATIAPLLADVRISEFMASNTKTLLDEDGEYSDWIELQNTGSATVDLDNWFLTDDATQLSKWRFPSTNLPPKGVMLVFASNKNRAHPGAPLHTNFKLSGSGEYLALVAPGGKEIVSSFAPTFPPQVDDVSYGYDPGLRILSIIGSNAPVRLLVPSDDALSTNWVQTGFNDASWRSVKFPVGFELGALDKIPRSNLLSGLVGYWKMDETTGSNAVDSSGLGNLAVVSGLPSNIPAWTNGLNQGALRFRGSVYRSVARVADYPKATNALSVSAWVWADARTTWASIAKNWSSIGGQFFFGLRDVAGDLDVSIKTTSGTFNVHEGTVLSTGTWHHVMFTADGQTLRLFRDGVMVGSNAYTGTFLSSATAPLGIGARLNDAGTAPDSAQGGIWNGRLDDVAIWNRAASPAEIQSIYEASRAFGATVATDLAADLYGRGSSVFLRVPFVLSEAKSISGLAATLRYNDGVHLWLNGEPIAQMNSPEAPSWNAAALEVRPSLETSESTLLNLSDFTDLLLPGTNVLAIQLLSSGSTDADLFLDLTSEAASSLNTTNNLVYFTSSTPGRENRYGVESLGPIISDVQHLPAIPSDDQDLLVTSRVVPTFGPIGSVVLRYRTMYSNDVFTTMFDDGAHGDGIAGDHIYAGVIPANAASPGQMIRYSILASDNSSRTNRLPLFPDKLHSEEYFGTVVSDPSVSSAMPIMQWFLKSPSSAESDPGTQCSLFYDGEFYDNVYVRIRGGTSRSWPKKSYKVEMTPEHEFRIRKGVATVTEFDLNTTYTDKSYVRAQLVSEFQHDSGMPSPEIFPLRLQQNAKFYSVTLLTEQVDAAFLRRYGLDDHGALYKGGPGSNGDTETSFEKKTRKTESNADLKAFLKGLTLKAAALETFVFDNIDLPAQVEFIATVAVTQNIDGSDKNYFLYRDTEGNAEWRMLPWDLDLTFGPNALNTDTIVFNESNSTSPGTSHPFLGSKSWMLSEGKYSTIIDAVVNSARGRQMVLRRLRTLTDQYLLKPYFQNRIEELYAQLLPDVVLDRAKWKSFGVFDGTDYTLRQALDRIKNEYLLPRAPYLASASIPGILGWNPTPQSYAPPVQFGDLLVNPPSKNQLEEYVQLVNTNGFPIDLSGWKLAGDIDFTFKSGTVLCSNSVLYVSPHVASFRARVAGPRGGQGLFVQGDYRGQLSARGGTLRLLTELGREIATVTYAGAPSLAQQYLRVSELMYHPVALNGDPYKAEEYEYLELKNSSSTTALDLSGVSLTRGVFFTFPPNTTPLLAPGGRVLLVRNLTAFQARYGTGRPVVGTYLGSLSNGDETLRIEDAFGEKILEFRYQKEWFPITDGFGFSLTLPDDSVPWNAFDQRSSWTVTRDWLGSPGVAGGTSADIASVVVNEVAPTPRSPAVDTVELFNPTGASIDISGWYLTDDFQSPRKYRIPSGTVLPAGGFKLIDEKAFNTGASAFQLSADGDEIWLFSADPTTGNLTGYEHGFSFNVTALGKSWGRVVDSVGAEHFAIQSQPTLGAGNAGPAVGPLTISEIHYHPNTPPGVDEGAMEFIELRNVSAAAVNISAIPAAGTGWKVTGGIKFDFTAALDIPPGASLLLVGFDPQNDPTALAGFKQAYSVPDGVPLVGPWKGGLANNHETLELLRALGGTGTNILWERIDQVVYEDRSPWPLADGDGTSLQKVSGSSFGEDPGSWRAAWPSAGRNFAAGSAPQFLVQPEDQSVVAFQPAEFRALASGDAPVRFQWWYGGEPLWAETNSVLRLSSVGPELFGWYRVTAFNGAGSATSSNAFLSVQLPPFITLQPLSRSVRIGSNVVFSVSALGRGNMSYQWKRDGVDVPGATGTSFTIPNAQPSDSGIVQVQIRDDVGPILSNPATLTVVVPPKIVNQPDDATVLVSETLRLQVEASGTAPLTYRWRRNNNTVLNQTNPLLSAPNASAASAGNYTVVVGNFAGSVTSRVSIVSVLLDADKDGIADIWETQFGFNPASNADAALDPDGDGVSNREEYLAGTDPKDPKSYLHFEPVQWGQGAESGSMVLSFSAVSNHTYAVLGRNSLSSGGWTSRWSFASQPTHSVIRITNGVNGASGEYYRIQTPRLP